MSPFPARMADHWWERPGRTPGRDLYHWHMLFRDQPSVRALAARVQGQLEGLDGLEPIALEWLHMTTYIAGFADEIPDEGPETMAAEARRILSEVPPIPVTLQRVFIVPQAIVLPAEPAEALRPVLEAVRNATAAAGCDGHIDQDPWIPHVSVAYSHGDGSAEPIIAALDRRWRW